MTRALALAAALAVLAVACGGPQSSSPDGPACPTVAAHLVELAERDNAAEAPPDLAAAMQAELERSCRDQAWSSARRTCLAEARSQNATLDCPAE